MRGSSIRRKSWMLQKTGKPFFLKIKLPTNKENLSHRMRQKNSKILLSFIGFGRILGREFFRLLLFSQKLSVRLLKPYLDVFFQHIFPLRQKKSKTPKVPLQAQKPFILKQKGTPLMWKELWGVKA